MTHDELMALLDKATAGEWPQPNDKSPNEATISLPFAYVSCGGSSNRRHANAAAIVAAINYLRSDEFRRVREDAARYRWLRDSRPCSFALQFNDHHNVYQTVAETFEDSARDQKADYYGDCPPEEREKMIATDTIWTLHIYPNTPIGFNVYHAATLDAAVDAARDKGGEDGH